MHLPKIYKYCCFYKDNTLIKTSRGTLFTSNISINLSVMNQMSDIFIVNEVTNVAEGQRKFLSECPIINILPESQSTTVLLCP